MDDVIGGEVESLQVDKGISDKEEVKLIDCEDIRQWFSSHQSGPFLTVYVTGYNNICNGT